ncbi:MAG: MFS transporter [Propionibacteriaceae bacterium]|nr:MFS transporter [Propionibacteriaceae bacterium]
MGTTRHVPGRSRLLIGLVLSIFGIAFETIGVATAMPTVMLDLGAPQLYAWAFSTMVTGMLLSTLISGRIVDRIGPLGPMVVGYVLFALGLLLGTLAPNVWVLLGARFVQGLGAGALVLALFVTIAMTFDGAQRASVLGALSFVWLLPAFIGPPIAAWMTVISWRLVFSAMLPLLAVAALLALPAMRGVQALFVPADETEPMSWWTVTLVVLAPSLVQLTGEPIGAAGQIAAGIAGVASLVVGVPRVMPRSIRLFGSGLGPVVLTRGLMAGCFFAAEAFVLLMLQRVRGLDPLEAGLALTIGSIGWTTGSWSQARPWVRMRRDQLITVGALLCAVGLLTMVGFIGWSALPLWFGVFGWVIAGLGMGVMMPSTSVAIMGLSSAQEQGRNNSALQVGEGLGNALLTGLAGAIYVAVARQASPQTSFVWLFSALTAICILAVVVSRRIGPIENDSLVRVST